MILYIFQYPCQPSFYIIIILFVEPNLKIMNYLFIKLICAFTAASAQWQDTIEGNNVLYFLQLTTQKFDRIEISAPFNVIVEKGDHHEVKITSKSNVILEVFTEVKNNTLLLSTSNNVKFFGNAIERTHLIVQRIFRNICIGSAKVSSGQCESKYCSRAYRLS